MYVARIEIPPFVKATRLKNGDVVLVIADDMETTLDSKQANDLATWIFATDTGA